MGISQATGFQVQDEEFDGDVDIGLKPSFYNTRMKLQTMARYVGVDVVLEG